MTAQILSIISFLLSWLWWVILALSFPGFLILQVVWCCKIRKCGLVAAFILSTLGGIASFFAAVWMLVEWKYDLHCEVFFLMDSGPYWTPPGAVVARPAADFCRELAWAVVALLEGILLCVTAYCLFVVVYYRFDKIINETNTPKQNEYVQVVPSVEMAIVTAVKPQEEQNRDIPDVESDKA